MRAILLILATVGALAVCLSVAIAFGLFRLSSVAPPTGPVRVASTQPADTDDADLPDVKAPGITSDAPDLDIIPPPGERAIILRAADAKVSGPRITVGSAIADKKRGKNKDGSPIVWKWREPNDVAEWTFVVPKAGRYTITLDYSAGDETQAGGEFVLSVGGREILGTLPDTRKSKSYQQRDIGEVPLPAGQARLTIHPRKKIDAGLMNLRDVRLFLND